MNDCVHPVGLLMVMSDLELLTTDLPVNYNLRSTMGIRTGGLGPCSGPYGIVLENGSLSSDCWGQGLKGLGGWDVWCGPGSKLRLWENWWWGMIRRAAGKEEQGKWCLEILMGAVIPDHERAIRSLFFLGQYEWPTVLVLRRSSNTLESKSYLWVKLLTCQSPLSLHIV